MPSSDVPILEVRHLTVKFAIGRGLVSKQTLTAVDDVSVSVRRGEVLGIVGESGSGKTTLARTVVKLVTPDSGSVYIDGRDIFDGKAGDPKAYRRKVQMIFQDPYESLNPRATAERAIEEPIVIHEIMSDRSARLERVSELIETVGLNPAAVAKKYPHELSGGERQRISIARALAVNPELLLADEPVSMLDVSIRIGVLDLLKELKRKLNLTVVFITHDLGVARYFCDRIAVMQKGRLLEVAETEELIRRPSDPYTKLLLDSVPDPKKH